MRAVLAFVSLLAAARIAAAGQELPIFDSHMRYNYDAWDVVPPNDGVEILKEDGVTRTIVSSNNDGFATKYGFYLHSHADADAGTDRFQQASAARVLSAHSGFERPQKVRELLRRYPNLWCDLALLSSHPSNGKVLPGRRETVLEFPGQ